MKKNIFSLTMFYNHRFNVAYIGRATVQRNKHGQQSLDMDKW